MPYVSDRTVILVDSSVWVAYFKGIESARVLQGYFDSDTLIYTNPIILAELLPALYHRGENKMTEALLALENLPLQIHWLEIYEMQRLNLKNGINKIGIPDLLIGQNAKQHQVPLLTFDKHFYLMEFLHQLPLCQQAHDI